jgi:hypothetical protein
MKEKKSLKKIVLYVGADDVALSRVLKRQAKKYKHSVSSYAMMAIEAGLGVVGQEMERIYRRSLHIDK